MLEGKGLKTVLSCLLPCLHDFLGFLGARTIVRKRLGQRFLPHVTNTVHSVDHVGKLTRCEHPGFRQNHNVAKPHPHKGYLKVSFRPIAMFVFLDPKANSKAAGGIPSSSFPPPVWTAAPSSRSNIQRSFSLRAQERLTLHARLQELASRVSRLEREARTKLGYTLNQTATLFPTTQVVQERQEPRLLTAFFLDGSVLHAGKHAAEARASTPEAGGYGGYSTLKTPTSVSVVQFWCP